MANAPEISLIQQSWLLGTFDDVLANSQNFNWNTVSENQPQKLLDGSYLLAAILLSGNGIKAYDIVNKYNLYRFEQTFAYFMSLSIIRNEFENLLKFLGSKNIRLAEPTNFYILQNKQDENGLYPEIKEAKKYIKELFDRLDSKSAIDFLINETYNKNNFQASSALAELTFSRNILNEALLAYSKCISLNPNIAFYWGEAGRVLWKMNCPVSSLYFLNQAIKLDRYNPHWYFSKMCAYSGVLGIYKYAWTKIDSQYKILYGRIIWMERDKNIDLAHNYISSDTPIALKDAIINNINNREKMLYEFGLSF